MLADYFVKMSNDHPLLTYIEDPFAEGDVLGYQKLLKRLKSTQVKVGVQTWFGSDMEKLQDYTQMIQLESEDEDDEEEKQEEDEEERLRREAEEKKAAEEAALAAAEAAKKQPQAKGGKKPDASEVVDPDIPSPDDPNGQKFVPDVIHFDKSLHSSI